MPQLDSLTYFTQAFWLVVLFLGFYLIIANEIVPNIATILKARNKLLKSGIKSTGLEASKTDVEALILKHIK